MREGVIKFELEHHEAELEISKALENLAARRSELVELRLIGRIADRYDGVGFGNISVRAPEGFFVSGTQTSGLPSADVQRHFAIVEHWEAEENRLVSKGPVRPSSESMTHAMIYEAVSDAHCVLHVHSPEIWSSWQRLSLGTTSADIEYGTPQMARAVRELARECNPKAIAMLGHEDGVIVWGATVDAAYDTLLDLYRQATK